MAHYNIVLLTYLLIVRHKHHKQLPQVVQISGDKNNEILLSLFHLLLVSCEGNDIFAL